MDGDKFPEFSSLESHLEEAKAIMERAIASHNPTDQDMVTLRAISEVAGLVQAPDELAASLTHEGLVTYAEYMNGLAERFRSLYELSSHLAAEALQRT